MRPLILVSLLLAVCTPLPATTPLPAAQVSFFENTPVPVDLATYRDAEAGIELDYPPSWG